MTPEQVYIVLFVLMVIEGVGMPAIPLEPVFIISGYYIEQGEVSFWLAVMLGTLGNFIGNLLGYWLGAKPGRRYLEWCLKRWHKWGKGWENVQGWFDRYGGAIVVIARWFGPIRTPTIIGAGMCGMRPSIYAFYSLIGSFTWTLAWQFGCWKGTAIVVHWWQEYRELVIIALLLAVLLAVGGWSAYRRYRCRPAAAHIKKIGCKTEPER